MGDALPQVNWRLQGTIQERHSGVVALLFTDVVGSTALKQRLGDRSGVDLLQEHHALVRRTFQQFEGAEELGIAGDSFLVSFPIPSDAVKCAVLLQSRLRDFNQNRDVLTLDRIGLHMGEVQIEHTPPGPKNVYGIQVDICSRVMSSAKGGQILMTRPVFDNARQTIKEIEGVGSLVWLNHGQFELKGLDEPVEICEVREADVPGLSAPTTSEKVRHLEVANRETVLGWRPGVGQAVPNTKWVLEEKLGEGGFGEVWKARHQNLKENCVFKFCFRADRVRSLKREVTLFRVLKERVGEHPNIVKLHDIYFDQPPFFLQEEYVPGRDLKHWCELQGGIGNVPLETRLEIVAQAADALQAAHDAGVIHRDVKPGNILLKSAPSEASSRQQSTPTVKLTDFGIGQVISAEVLKDVTRSGFTVTLSGNDGSSHAGTQLYMAPELFEDKLASTRSDIYSLGVVLYQLLVGDFKRPLTTDWGNDISDPLLQEDLHRCFAGKPEDRFAAAGLLAKNLRTLRQRQTELERQAAEKAALERSAYRRGVARTAAIAAGIMVVIGILGWQARSNGLAKIRQAAQIRSTAVRLTVANGLNPAENGDWLSAALWFSEAFVLDESFGFGPDPEPYRQTHLLRISSVLRQSPRLERMWFDMTGFSTGFADDDSKVFLGSTNGYRLHSIASGEPSSPIIGRGAQWASLAPDGIHAVSGGGSLASTYAVWDVHSGKRVLVLLQPGGQEPFRGDCKDLQYSPDGRWIAAVVAEFPSNKLDRVVIWDAKTARVQRTMFYTNAPNLEWTTNMFLISARFDASGERLVTTASDNCAVVWHWRSNSSPQKLRGHNSWVYSACFGRLHTNWLVTCSFDRTACLWDLETGRPLRQVKHESDAIFDVQFSPDERTFATAGLDFGVRLWESETGLMIPPVLRSHDRTIRLQWSAGGGHVLGQCRDGTIRLWRLNREKTMIVASTCDYTDDGRQMLTVGRDGVCVENTSDHLENASPTSDHTNLLALSFAGEPSRYFCSSNSTPDGPGQLELRKIPAGELAGAPLTYDPSARLVCAPAAPRFALFGGTSTNLVGGDAHLFIWEPESEPAVRKLRFTNELFEAVAFDHSGNWIAVGTVRTSGVGVVRLLNRKAPERPVALPQSRLRIRHLEFSKDDRWLVAACWDDDLNPGEAVVWRSAAPGKPYELAGRLPHLDGVIHATVADSGQAIATGSEDQTAIVWQRMNTGWQPSLRPFRCNGQVFLCAFSRSGRWLATANRTAKAQQTGVWISQVRIWDIANNEARSLPFEFHGELTRLSFLGDDQHLYVERRSLSGPAERWTIDLRVAPLSAKELLLQAQLLSSQRSFLSGRAEQLTSALEGKLSAETALLHATSIGPLRPLTKQDCQDLWRYVSQAHLELR